MIRDVYFITAWNGTPFGNGLDQQIHGQYRYSKDGMELAVYFYKECPDTNFIRVMKKVEPKPDEHWVKVMEITRLDGAWGEPDDAETCENCGSSKYIRKNASGDTSCDNCGWCDNDN